MSAMRCAIYARYSSDLQRDRSIDDQVRNCRQFAEKKDWVVLDGHIYTDRAVSGATIAGRSGLAELLKTAEAKPRPFDYVLVDDTSRLSRDKIEQLQIIRDLEDSGIFIYFVSDNIDTRDETAGDVLLPVYGIKDSLYIRELGKKTKRGMTGQVLKGYNAGGRTYGYKYTRVPDPTGAIDKKTRQVRSVGTKIEIDSEQSKVVKTIFAMYASGYGLKAIAIRLTDQGVDPPGKELQLRKGHIRTSWCPNAIRVILRNPKYIGNFVWNRTKSVRKRKTGKRTYIARPKDEWVEYKNPSLAIIDAELWDAVQARNEANAARHKKGRRSPRKNYLLSGLMKCGICGANLIVVRCQDTGDVQYGCSFNWHRGSMVCPNNIRIRKSDIEDRVLSAIKERVLNPDVVSVLVEKVNLELKKRLNSVQAEQQSLIERAQKITSEVKNLIDFVADSGEVSPMIRDAIKIKESELSRIKHQIEWTGKSTYDQEVRVEPAYVVKWLSRLEELIQNDILAARVEVGKIIGELIATPVSKSGQTGVILSGKPRIDGVLGVVSGVSTLINGGGRI